MGRGKHSKQACGFRLQAAAIRAGSRNAPERSTLAPMWSRTSTVPSLVASTLLLGGCGGSSTAQREPAAPPVAAPNPDVGKDNAGREAALRRQAPASAPAHTDAPESEPER
jgi:hypothetical protein